MRKSFTSVVFDRKKLVETKGIGTVEVYIRLSKTARKYITIKKCTPAEWKRYSKSSQLKDEVDIYEEVAQIMYENNEEMTIEAFDARCGIDKAEVKMMRKTYKPIDYLAKKRPLPRN